MAKKLTVDYSKLSPSSLLKLMKLGAKVELPTGFTFVGDTTNQYIHIGYDLGTGRMVSDGCWNMNVEGAKKAIADAKKYEIENLKQQ
jgi:hypothetical protein